MDLLLPYEHLPLIFATVVVLFLVAGAGWGIVQWFKKNVTMTVTDLSNTASFLEDTLIYLHALMLSNELTDEQVVCLHSEVIPLLKSWEAENKLAETEFAEEWVGPAARVH